MADESDKPPEGWRKNNDGVYAPSFLVEAVCLSQHTVAAKRVSEEQAEDAIGQFETAVHSLFNNTCRVLGCEVEGRESEMTSEYVQQLGNSLRRYVKEVWKDQDAEKEHEMLVHDEKLRDYRVARATVARLRAELGLKDGDEP